MQIFNEHAARVHDLVEVDVDALNPDGDASPSWADLPRSLSCWVTVRRGVCSGGKIPIGVRGNLRNERWSTHCLKSGIRCIARPEELLERYRHQRPGECTLAIRALDDMIRMWSGLGLAWGPIGSVGYELATGKPITTDSSDLDLVLYSPLPISRTLALTLFRRTESLAVRVDIRVETSRCGFSLEEYACSAHDSILLRHNHGLSLGHDPWRIEPEISKATEVAIPI
jgi:phosphoribosyl-dephospho-CoA transferase